MSLPAAARPRPAAPPSPVEVYALGPAARAACGALLALAGGWLALATTRVAHDLVIGGAPVPPLDLARDLALLALGPLLVARIALAAARAELFLEPTHLVVRRGATRWEIPRDAIARVEPWRLPLPGPGVWLRLASGRRFPLGLQTDDPGALLASIDADRLPTDPTRSPHAPHGARTAITDSTLLRWAHARAAHHHRHHRRPARLLAHLAIRFVLFPLLPTLLLFRVHQYITYGGLLGEYHLLGLTAWLRTFAVYAAATTAHLVLLASLLRALAEPIALAAARRGPGPAAAARRAVEIGCAIGYYGGTAALLAIRFFG